MEGVSSRADSISGDDSAEFEIIQQAGHDHDEDNDYGEPPAALFQIHSATTTVTPLSSSASSYYGAQSSAVSVVAPSAADASEVFGVGKSMSASSVSAYQSQSLLDSMYSIPPFTHSPHMEKLVTLLHEEQNKNRTMLEAIMQTVTDLSKERDDNTELRTQNQALKTALQQELDKSAELASVNKSMSLQLTELEARKADVDELLRKSELKHHKAECERHTTAASLKLMDGTLAELRQALVARDTNARQTLAERDSALAEAHAALALHEGALADARRTLDETRRALADRDDALAEARHALAHRDSELASHAEIVNVLQEERGEMARQIDANRVAYRRNLDALEAQMAGAHERGEFPDGSATSTTDHCRDEGPAPTPTVNIRNSDVTVLLNHRRPVAGYGGGGANAVYRRILAFLLRYLKYSAEIIFYLSLPLFLYFVIAILFSSDSASYGKGGKYRNQRKYDYI